MSVNSVVALTQPLTTNKAALLVTLAFLVLTFSTTRLVTMRIRENQQEGTPEAKGLLKNFSFGGVHVHHQVFGITLLLSVGLLGIAYHSSGPVMYVLAALFGVGAALTLDEFALWFYLDDVYWSAEGRTSIDAVFLAAFATFLLAVGTWPLTGAFTGGGLQVLILGGIAVNMVLVLVTLLKGKIWAGVTALFVPFLSIVTAFRLARPDSWWDRKRYQGHPEKHRRAGERAHRIQRQADSVVNFFMRPETDA
jgi:hypothetical protein